MITIAVMLRVGASEVPMKHQSLEVISRGMYQKAKLGLTFPSCCSVREKASMKAWAITDKQLSMCGVFLMSKTN